MLGRRGAVEASLVGSPEKTAGSERRSARGTRPQSAGPWAFFLGSVSSIDLKLPVFK